MRNRWNTADQRLQLPCGIGDNLGWLHAAMPYHVQPFETVLIRERDYFTGGNCTRFTSDLGLDDSVQGKGAVIYQLYADGQKVYDSGVVTNTTPTIHADVNISGAHILQFHVALGNGTNQFGNADFGDAQLTCNS